MKSCAFFLLLMVLFGCKKHEVDLAALNTNPFDNDHTGTHFMRLDSIRYFPTGQGNYYQQRLYVHLAEELRAERDYQLRMIDLTQPDTTFFPAPINGAATVVMANHQLTPGMEYCLLVDLVIGGTDLINHRLNVCGTVEL